jgi:hypothetical protein
MQDFEKLGAFYLGREVESKQALLYDSKDLVTHAVCVGMTGSGKTGLCLDLLEEAAIDGLPAICIDPKGDIANILLQFPELRGEDFAPWVNEEDAKRQQLSRDEFAARQADQWKQGLAEWGQDGARIRRLQDAADFAIYTPGSDAGVPISLLRSFDPPAEGVDREVIRDRVAGTASAVLSLLGIESEPMQGREHILLSNIFMHTWQQGASLSVEELIHAIQSPPMKKVGVLDLDAFYPAKERFALAMSLNNLLAAPGFECWLEGEALDVGKLLYTPEGKPRIAVLSIAHLSDSERMFFVTLVLNELLAWTRQQSGTTSLRAIFYMDEIFGYFPPIANPPSKRPLLTLLKQARAYGVGIVLATQNPVDLDYKGLSNTGSWFIGRLQTERDKQRLLEGLEGASGQSGASFNREQMDKILSSLGKRMFLLNNVHDEHPVLFESRWAMSYLRGPMTRAQIRKVMEGRRNVPIASIAASAPPTASLGSARSDSAANDAAPAPRTVLPPDVPQAFIPLRGSAEDVVYRPTLLGTAQVRYVDAKADVDFLAEKNFLTPIVDDSIPVQWEECAEIDIDPNELEKKPQEGIPFGPLPSVAAKGKSYVGWTKDLVNWIYGHQQIELYRSVALKAASQPNESEGEFRVRIQQALREERDRAVAELRRKYDSKTRVLEDRLRRAEQAVERERQQAQSQTLNSVIDVGTGLLGAFFGRKRATTAARDALRGAGRYHKESGDIGRAAETEEAVQQQLAELNAAIEAEVHALQADANAAQDLQTLQIKPKKTNINVRLFTLAWAPYKHDGTPAF